MREHLSIKIKDKFAVLPEDFSIDVEDVNPIFNDYETFSFDASLPIEPNRHILSNIDSVRSDKRMVEMENNVVQIIVDGVPFRSGNLQTNEGEQIQDDITFSMVSSTRTITDMVANLQCRDVPVKDLIQIGEMVGDVKVDLDFEWRYYVHYKYNDMSVSTACKWQKSSTSNDMKIQALGFSFPGVCELSGIGVENAVISGGKPKVTTSFINVTDEYPTKPYCNGRVCYTHYKREDDGTSGKTVSTENTFDPYFILEADRPQSGVCFYLLYFLDCLFHYLGITYDNSSLLSVGDMKRLCFFTTHCKYNLVRKYPEKGIVGQDESVSYDFSDISEINKWLESRNAGGELIVGHEPYKDLSSIDIRSGLSGSYVTHYEIGKEGVRTIRYESRNVISSVKANIMNMYANSENFPDMGVGSVIDSLWNSFGIRFIMDYEKNIVKPIFIRDVYRDNSTPIEIKAYIINVYKINEKITGVRIKYSAESDKAEQLSNIRYGVMDYDTDYDYTDYRKVDSSLGYVQILKKGSCSDTTCYIDRTTGNAYRIKVDKDATKISELKPSIFEVGGFKGVEIGDCSDINDDFVIEFASDFTPLVFNDVNGRYEKAVGGEDVPVDSGAEYVSNSSSASAEQILAAFVDEEMWNENMEVRIDNTMGNSFIDAYLRESITTDESYDPSSTEDGNSPLQHYDWGSAITLMRGGGSSSRIEQYDYDYDGCGNSKWRIVASKYTMATDSIDNWGADFDYNGETAGIGEDERFSLKIRAFKVVDGEILCNDDERDEDGRITRKVRSRGLFDTFMSEHAHFLLNRKKLGIEFRCEISDLLNIQWNKRYRIGEYTFWWNKLNYSISVKNGLGIVSAEVFTL